MPLSVSDVQLDTRRLNAIIAHLDGNTDDVVLGLALEGEGIAKTVVPVDTGALRASIFARLVERGVAILGATMEYAPEVELGTTRMTGRPYIGEAIRRLTMQLAARFGRVCTDE